MKFNLLKITAAILLGVVLSSQIALAANGCNTYSVTLVKGSSQYLSASDSSSLSLTGTSTIEVWVNVTTTPSSGTAPAIVFKGDYNTHNSYQLFYSNDAGTPTIYARFFASDGNTNYATSKWAYTLTTGTWFHIAVVISPQNATASKFELFINGVSQGNGTASMTGSATSIVDLTVGLGIGQSIPPVGVTDYYFDGKVDEVRIWNTARTSSEISANYQTQLVGTESNLQAYWQLNNALTDKTANGNTLTNNGSASFTTSVPFNSGCASFDFSNFFGW